MELKVFSQTHWLYLRGPTSKGTEGNKGGEKGWEGGEREEEVGQEPAPPSQIFWPITAPGLQACFQQPGGLKKTIACNNNNHKRQQTSLQHLLKVAKKICN